MMPFPMFDRSRLCVKPLAERVHDLTLDSFIWPDDAVEPFADPALPQIADRIVKARRAGAPVILLMGAHVIRSGVSPLLIALMENRLITHIGVNGAGPIHDYELALIGATTESVARYISEGQFGLWQETGRINDIVAAALSEGLGYGEAVGRAIEQGNFPHRGISILAAGFRLHVPVTVHVGIGYDIIYEHPNCNGAVMGEASYRDFLILAETISHLQGGVLLSAGSAVMAPEVYLKALAMARNVARQEGRRIDTFTTAVFDLQDLGENIHHEAPKSDARYYFRPYKTILVRTVQDGGESFYVRGPHRLTLPNLYKEIMRLLNG